MNVKVVACRGSITDYDKASYLQGGTPRGWDQGSVWEKVPGVALHDRTAVIATKEFGGKRVPSPYGNGHGAYNLVGHEFLHAFNFGENVSGRGTVDPKFRKSRLETLKMIERISPSILSKYNIEYYKQKGEPGRQESHAESGCRWFYGDQLMRTSDILRPLAEYWKAVEHELGISS